MIVFFLIDLSDAAASYTKDHIISGKTVCFTYYSQVAGVTFSVGRLALH